ncbi:hypothetical protein EDB81DRAFT_390816 [Dactylonectria macrodidyma]|uniref:Uncharacterized protein n=1 Tax=Dactylonectria macrodidyma TaxID=307937 RepID=A0A9P9F821_9HYPO|nr:hypothetical protein EDB81DRAFT_390816 [Dactylonectria macrodidyma]
MTLHSFASYPSSSPYYERSCIVDTFLGSLPFLTLWIRNRASGRTYVDPIPVKGLRTSETQGITQRNNQSTRLGPFLGVLLRLVLALSLPSLRERRLFLVSFFLELLFLGIFLLSFFFLLSFPVPLFSPFLFFFFVISTTLFHSRSNGLRRALRTTRGFPCLKCRTTRACLLGIAMCACLLGSASFVKGIDSGWSHCR